MTNFPIPIWAIPLWAAMWNAIAAEMIAHIPAPWVDPDIAVPAQPVSWTVSTPGYFFIDQTLGSDTGTGNGTPLAPRKTLRPGNNTTSAGEYGPGTLIVLRGPVYSIATAITYIRCNGTSDAWVADTAGPVFITSEDPENPCKFTKEVQFFGHYGVMTDVANSGNAADPRRIGVGSSSASAQRQCSHLLLRNIDIDGQNLLNSVGISIVGSTYYTTNHIIAYNCEVHDEGGPVPTADIDHVGIFPQNYVEDIWVLNNEIHDMAGGGVAMSTLTSGTTHTQRIYVVGNHIYNTWATGIGVKTTIHTVVSNNHVHDIIYASWSTDKGLSAQYAVYGAWYMFNTVHHVAYGLRCGSTSSATNEYIWIIGNLFYAIYPVAGGNYSTGAYAPACVSLWGCDQRFIIANMMVDSLRGFTSPASPQNTLGQVLENNVFAFIEDDDIYIDLSSSWSWIASNCFYRPVGNTRIRLSNTTYTHATLPVGNGNSNISVDPDFNDRPLSDYRIADDSPVRAMPLPPTSLRSDVYATYLANIGGTIADEYRTYGDSSTPLLTPPNITSSPTSRTVNAGSSTSFSVASTGSIPKTYQWYKDTVSLGGGAVSNPYTIANVQAAHAGSYTVRVTNDAGFDDSDAAVLTVLVPDVVTPMTPVSNQFVGVT